MVISEDFVGELADQLDDLAVKEGVKPSDFVETWQKVLDIEKRFWPDMKGAELMDSGRTEDFLRTGKH